MGVEYRSRKVVLAFGASFLALAAFAPALAQEFSAPRQIQSGAAATATLPSAAPVEEESGPSAFFQVPARAGQLVTVTVASDAFAPTLIMGQAMGDPREPYFECARCPSVFAEGPGTTTLRAIAQSDEPFVVMVRSAMSDQGGAFTIRAQTSRPPRVQTAPLAYGTSANGTWTPSDGLNANGSTIDAYTIQMTEGRPVQIDLSSEDETVDPFMLLFAPGAVAGDDAVAADDDMGPGLSSRIRFTPGVTGTYRLEVQQLSGAASGRYRVSAGPVTVPPAFAVTNVLTPGMQIDGTLSQSSPRIEDGGEEQIAEYFRFMARAGEGYVISARSTVFDTMIAVGQLDGTTDFVEQAMNDDGGGEDGTNSRLVFIPAEPGPHTIQLMGLGGGTGAFTVGMERFAVRPLPAAGTPLVMDGQAVRGALSLEGPFNESGQSVDFYSVSLAQGQTVRVRMNAVPGQPIDPLLEIGTGTPAAFESLATDDDSGREFDARLDFTAPAAGPYLIRAMALGLGQAGPYEISAGPAIEPPMPEPRPLTPGTRVGGVFRATDTPWDPDLDMVEHLYSFEAAAGSRYLVIVDGIGEGGSAMDAVVRARGAGPDEAWQSDDDSGGDLDPRLEYQVVTSGRQTVAVAALASGLGHYLVSVTPIQ
jgi:hypothetical protein